MLIRQGDIYWLDLSSAEDERIAHPHVVIQADVFNHYPAIKTVIVCALTTNAKKISVPGNILLENGEANLARASIIEVSKVLTVEKSQLGEYIGTLSEQRVQQILANLQFLQASFFNR